MPNLTAPTVPVFLVSVALAVLALLGQLVKVPFLTTYDFWIAIIAFVVLTVGVLLKDV